MEEKKSSTNKSKRIFLVGMPGAGKSSVSKALQRMLGLELVDTDRRIEFIENKNTSQIIKEDGIDYFRKLESMVILAIAKKEVSSRGVVVATGGGALEDQTNLRAMLASGTLVYLALSEKSLLKRLILSKKERPLLDKKNLAQSLKKIKQKREQHYLKSDIVVFIDDLSIEEVAQKICAMLNLNN